MNIRWLIACLVCLCSATTAHAYDVEMRPVVWNGNAFQPVCGNTLHVLPGSSTRIRVQMRAVDNMSGPTPTGGLFGWVVGGISTTGGTNTRTPGRLSPFTGTPNGNGVPSADPFMSISNIDATLGVQRMHRYVRVKIRTWRLAPVRNRR